MGLFCFFVPEHLRSPADVGPLNCVGFAKCRMGMEMCILCSLQY